MNFSPIPKTAPFSEDEIEALNRVVGPASPTQRAWLAGFLAGLDAATTTTTQMAVGAQPAEPLTILYATESGNSERLASDMAKAARKMGLKPSIIDMADLDVATLALVRRLVVIAATWGEGDPPARAIRAYGELMGEGAPRLDDFLFSVLTLGDTAYADFCGIGQALDARLEALGGKRVADRVDCDLDFAEPAGRWIETALKALAPADEAGRSRVIAVDFGVKAASSADLGPVEAEITELIDVNSSQSEKETIHLELGFDGAAPSYKPGDSLEIYPENDGVKLAAAKPFTFTSTGDRYGWTESDNGYAHLTLFIENGRIKDVSDVPGGAQWLTGLRRIAEVHDGAFRLTANQNLIIANVPKDKRQAIEALVAEHGLTSGASALRRNAMSCVALPTCGLALAESERYLPDLVTALEERLAAHGLTEDDIVIRMTGCPNGCCRPYIAEIGLVGKGPGRYNLYLGAAFDGSRLSKLYAESLDHGAIIANLDPIFAAYKSERRDGEHFGDYAIRAGFIAATVNGTDFHKDTGARR